MENPLFLLLILLFAFALAGSVFFGARLRKKNSFLERRNWELEISLKQEEKANREKMDLLTSSHLQLSESFKALSADALKNNNHSFLELANAKLEKFQE